MQYAEGEVRSETRPRINPDCWVRWIVGWSTCIAIKALTLSSIKSSFDPKVDINDILLKQSLVGSFFLI